MPHQIKDKYKPLETKRNKINIGITDRQKQDIEIIQLCTKETTGTKATYNNILNAGIKKFKEDPYINLRAEELYLTNYITKLEEEKEKTINYYENEIRKHKKKLETTKEKINSSIKINLEEIKGKQNKKIDKKTLEQKQQMKNKLIENIKLAIKQQGIIDFNNKVIEIIDLNLNSKNFIKVNIPYSEVETIIKEWLHNTNTTPETTKKEQHTNNKKINKVNLTPEQQEALNKATSYLKNNYEKHGNGLTLIEFWNKKTNKNIPNSRRLNQLIENKYFTNSKYNFSSEQIRQLNRTLFNLIKNNEI